MEQEIVALQQSVKRGMTTSHQTSEPQLKDSGVLSSRTRPVEELSGRCLTYLASARARGRSRTRKRKWNSVNKSYRRSQIRKLPGPRIIFFRGILSRLLIGFIRYEALCVKQSLLLGLTLELDVRTLLNERPGPPFSSVAFDEVNSLCTSQLLFDRLI